jgi:hypothetical protein
MKRTAVAGSTLAIVLFAVACQDPMATTPAPTPVEALAEFAHVSTIAEAAIAYRLDRPVLPPSARVSDFDMASAARRAINPDDYVCAGSTAISNWWLNEALSSQAQEPAIFNFLYFDRAADLVPTYDALYFETEDTPQYFGYNGEYTHVLEKTHSNAGRFWDIDADGIQLIGMHGSMLLDVGRVAQTYQLLGLPPAVAAVWASEVRSALLQSLTLNGGNHSLFTFNAFAASFGAPFPDKIVLGDGVMAGYEALGFGDVAPQAIYAHEFAHHIQFQNGYFSDPHATQGDPPERTRYTELMADAMSAYYLTHKRGATMNRHRVAEFLEVFFQIGDCAFTNAGHHGTPNQRMAAAVFGFELADEAREQGHIMTSEQVHAAFVAAYPDIIAPDALP